MRPTLNFVLKSYIVLKISVAHINSHYEKLTWDPKNHIDP